MKTCARDGVSTVDVNAQSGCNGGGAYVCHDQQPWAVNDNLAYGFAAATVSVSHTAVLIYGCICRRSVVFRVNENRIGVALAIP